MKQFKTKNAINGRMKKCCKCKIEKDVYNFGNLKNTPDGLRYDCKDCRKFYRENNKSNIQIKQKEYYETNKNDLLIRNKEYRAINFIKINNQRQTYRNKPEVKQHIKVKNKEYLPIRKQNIKKLRQTNINFKMSEILRSKIHKYIKGEKPNYQTIIDCDLEFFKKWIEFRFDKNMNWNNIGEYWQIDHILPIDAFNCSIETDRNICFHWTNLQPLEKTENRNKSNKLHLHYYFNNIVNIHRFNSKYKQFLGYQAVNESLLWLRKKHSGMVITPRMI